MSFIHSIGEKKFETHSTFTSSQEVKKEINNILKIYSECNQNLVVDIMNMMRGLDKKYWTLGSDSAPIGVLIDGDTIENESESAKIYTSQIYKFFCKTLLNEKNLISNILDDFDFQTKNKEKKINIDKLPNINNLNKIIKDYEDNKPYFEKPLHFDKDLKIEIFDINNPGGYCLNHKESKWLHGQLLHFPSTNKDFAIYTQYFDVKKDGSLSLQAQITPDEVTKRGFDSIQGNDGAIREAFKNKKITHIKCLPQQLPNFCIISFKESKRLKIQQKCTLIFQSFKSFLNHQTEAIQHVYKLFQEYNEMLDLEKEAEKKIREELRKTAPKQESIIQSPPQKEFSHIHKKKMPKEPQLSKKEQIIQENSKQPTQTSEPKPALPIIYTTDTSLIEIFQAIMKCNDRKITWKQATACCSKLGYTIKDCGGSIHNFTYRNSLKALIPENELDKFVENIQEEKIEKIEETKTSKNIHEPHRKDQSHNEPLPPKLKNRFKLLFEETGFTIGHLQLEKKKI